jgi:DHA1 family bicyclomycin/chloramphenicol resistance-like MFS transporter
MLNLYSTIALMFLFLSCQGFSFPNSSALSLAPFDKEAGSAAALMGAFQMGLGALATAVVGMTNNGTALPLTGIMAACAISGLLIVSLGGKRIAFKAKLEDVEEQAFEQIERY